MSARIRFTLAAILAAVLLLPAQAVVAAPEVGLQTTVGQGLDPAVFAEPTAATRPTMLWFWNGTITTALIDSQLAELREHGVYEAVIFPFETAALQPAVFTEGWFDMVEHALREAHDNGMHLWLFNDSYFPSGRAAGLVINGGTLGGVTYPAHPEWRAQGVNSTQKTVTGPTTVALAPSTTGLSIEAGQLVVDAAKLNGVSTLTSGTAWTDYTLATRVTLGTGNSGVVVRAQDRRNGYLVDLRADGSMEIYRQVNGAFTLLAAPPAVAGFDPAVQHEVKVVVSGDTITPVLDGATRPGATDSTFASGTVGVRAVATQKSRHDTWTVTAPDNTVLYSQNFDSDSALADFVPLATAPANSVVSASARPAGSTSAADLVDLTTEATTTGTWQVPAGEWVVDTFTSSYLNGMGGYLDLMNPAATAAMMDIIPGEYYRRFPWAFGTVIKGFWDDEPFIASADAHFNQTPWSPGLPDALAAAGVAVGPALTGAFDDLGRDGRSLRGSFWRGVSDLFAENYYKVQYDWMADHGVEYISNPLWDEYGPAEQVESTGDQIKDHQWAQVPGTDVIFQQYEPGGRTMLPRYAASAAHQNGMDRVLLESFGGRGWGTDPEYMQATLGAFAVRGINYNVLHALWTDTNNVVYPPPFSEVNPWWDQSNPLIDWMGRVSYVASGKPMAPTALIVPQSAAESWQATPTADAIDMAFTAANNALEDNQSDFDLLHDGALAGDPAVRAQATVDAGTLAVGEQRYRLAVLPQTPTIDLAGVSLLTTFVQSGGTVVAIGDLPTEETTGQDAELTSALQTLFAAGADSTTTLGSGSAVRVATPAGVGPVIEATGVAAAELSPAAPSVRVLRVQTGDDMAFLIVNETASKTSTTATFPVAGVPELWNPRTGEVTAPSFDTMGTNTAVPLELEPFETAIVVVDTAADPAAAPHLVVGSGQTRDLAVAGRALTGDLRVTGGSDDITLVGRNGATYYSGTVDGVDGLAPVQLDGDWTVQLEKAGAVASDKPLGSWTQTQADRDYSGAASYSRSFELAAADLADREWTLDLGEVGAVAEVTVNGRTFDPVLWKPYTIDVSDALVAGANQISVRVSNTLANSKGEFKASGLLGPVSLTPAQWVPFSLAAAPEGGLVSLTVPTGVGVAPGQTVQVPVEVRRYGGADGPVPLTASASPGLWAALSPQAAEVDANGTATVSVDVTAQASASVPGTGSVTITGGGQSYEIPVRIDLASRFGTAVASSTYAGHPVSTINDGNLSSESWDEGQGWNDNTVNSYPDSVTIPFLAPAPISRVDLTTLGGDEYPAADFGVMDVDLELLVDGEWTTVQQVRGNSAGRMTVSFDPVLATAVRATVLDSRVSYSRIIELQAFPGVIGTRELSQLITMVEQHNEDGTVSDKTTANLMYSLDRAQAAAETGSEERTIMYLEQFIARAENQIKGDERDLMVRGLVVGRAQELVDHYQLLEDRENLPE